jgi:REP element-mobilizing transposase RayT
MILAYHAIFTAYGFWLPNDPRGSWSQFVAAWELFRAGGPATKTSNPRSVARKAHDHDLRLRTKQALKLPPVCFDGRQALSISKGFHRAASDADYLIHACAILPEHVHMVVARHQRRIENIVGHLKSFATRQLDEDGLHPFQGHDSGRRQSPWVERCWKVYLETPRDIRRAIEYVERNPEKEGKRRQVWSWVREYGA